MKICLVRVAVCRLFYSLWQSCFMVCKLMQLVAIAQASILVSTECLGTQWCCHTELQQRAGLWDCVRWPFCSSTASEHLKWRLPFPG